MLERSTGAMMFIGERCSLTSCNREDFLPFKCPDCRQSYCGSHFRPLAHQCIHHDEGADFRVPLCPLCDQPPQGWKRDEDPNIAMDRHLSAGNCPALDERGLVRGDRKGAATSATSVSTPPQRTKKPNECGFKKCSKVMLVPIQCPQCRSSFCPSHRAPAQHSCGSAPSSSTSAFSPSSKANSNRSSTASSAFKKLSSSVSKPIFPPLGKSSSKQDPPSSNDAGAKQKPTSALADRAASSKLFDKTDKRAKAERISAIKAMQARQERGLLTSAEETRLAEEMAAMAKISGGKTDSDCVIC